MLLLLMLLFLLGGWSMSFGIGVIPIWIVIIIIVVVIVVTTTTTTATGFYPKLIFFWSCSHMNCCQHYMLHINLHLIYVYFIKFNLHLKEFNESLNYFKSYQANKNEYFVELYFNLNLHLNLNIKPDVNS